MTPQLEGKTLDAHVQSRLREIDARERSQRVQELQAEIGELNHRLDEMRRTVSNLDDETLEARAVRAEEARAAAATEAVARGEVVAGPAEPAQHAPTQEKPTVPLAEGLQTGPLLPSNEPVTCLGVVGPPQLRGRYELLPPPKSRKAQRAGPPPRPVYVRKTESQAGPQVESQAAGRHRDRTGSENYGGKW